ncbi:DUF2007 domain-containing protein [Halopseudomonas phragmitis]|uniref:DUF2007 domain-containing protein n=2 Tax=Pseudomonadaceae TaxID=135621 RepID=A0A1V0B4W9_9GAMM|nr:MULTISPECIES: DUF2007 domain-containing protein [Pseudomonadaceae]AQZ94957.1 hypothetical protein BVH74_09435 [Halopseudomonas phragmitis]PAU87734.1 hypothetical protein CK507_09285 [Pseudomonas sp. WN033]RHW23118.1 hypothetical protein C2846_01570 [Pseudomonas jilinensis]
MLCAYNPRDLIEAELLKQLLSSHHIRCHLTGQYLQGAVGELPAHDLLGLWVEPADLGLARELINDWQHATPLDDEFDDPESEPALT